jgi:PAS domain S-box-containing protein
MRQDLDVMSGEAGTQGGELQEQLAVSQLVMEHAADAIFLLNDAGETVYANPAAEQMFGWSKAELVGNKLHEMVHHLHPDGRPYPMEDCPLGRVFFSGKSLQSHEDTFFHKDGRPVPVACSNAPSSAKASSKAASSSSATRRTSGARSRRWPRARRASGSWRTAPR